MILTLNTPDYIRSAFLLCMVEQDANLKMTSTDQFLSQILGVPESEKIVVVGLAFDHEKLEENAPILKEIAQGRDITWYLEAEVSDFISFIDGLETIRLVKELRAANNTPSKGLAGRHLFIKLMEKIGNLLTPKQRSYLIETEHWLAPYVEHAKLVESYFGSEGLDENDRPERLLRSCLSKLSKPEMFIPNTPVKVEMLGEKLDGVRKKASSIAKYPSGNILILGESGTGKELVARGLHYGMCMARNTTLKFESFNCGTSNPSLIDVTLFGHGKGAYTGSVGEKAGLFELADGGVLFLDEIGELPIDLQPKLLRAIQEGEIQRVGEEGKIKKVRVRVISATNRNLDPREPKVGNEKAFREDLYFRLATFELQTVPLRNFSATEKISIFNKMIYKRCSNTDEYRLSYKAKKVNSRMSLHDLIPKYLWPGNLREMENMVDRYLAYGAISLSNELEELIARQPKAGRTTGLGTIELELQDLEAMQQIIAQKAVEMTGTNIAAGELLGKGRDWVARKIKGE